MKGWTVKKIILRCLFRTDLFCLHDKFSLALSQGLLNRPMVTLPLVRMYCLTQTSEIIDSPRIQSLIQGPVVDATADSGKTRVRILGVQPEFCRKGGGELKCLAKWVVAVLE